MPFSSRRLSREYKTIEAMVRIFCRDHHQEGGRLCESCEELRAYAQYRLEKCPFGAEKPTCVNCKVHCYQAAMRERVREVMPRLGEPVEPAYAEDVAPWWRTVPTPGHHAPATQAAEQPVAAAGAPAGRALDWPQD